MLDNIINYIKENKILLIIIGVLLALLIILFISNKSKSTKNNILNNNLEAATSQMDSLRLANGDLLVQKQSYVATIEELEKYLNISKSELKSLQKTLDNKILYISNLEAQVNINNIKASQTKVDTTKAPSRDSTYVYPFNFSDRWYKLTGNTSFSFNSVKTEISHLYVNVPLKVGLTEDWKIFVTTPNPYVTFSDINGAILDKDTYTGTAKKKKFGLGLNVGYFAGYDLIGNKFYTGPGAGLSFTYMIF